APEGRRPRSRTAGDGAAGPESLPQRGAGYVVTAPFRTCAVRRDSLRAAVFRWSTPLVAARWRARDASRSSVTVSSAFLPSTAACSFLMTLLTPDCTERLRARRFSDWRAAFKVFL